MAPPSALRVASVLLSIQALAAVGYGAAEIVGLQPDRPAVGLGVGLVFVVYGVGLGVVARGLHRVRRWSRGPAVATQLIHLPVAWWLRTGPTWWVALLLGVAAVIILVAVLLPGSTAALVGRPGGEQGAPEPGGPEQD